MIEFPDSSTSSKSTFKHFYPYHHLVSSGSDLIHAQFRVLAGLMASFPSNDLNSPVSLLWAHQLRKEHATIVAQLEEIKGLHPSASELKKLVTRTEKTEVATNNIRKDFTDLRTAHQKSVKSISGIEENVRTLQRVHTGDVAGSHDCD